MPRPAPAGFLQIGAYSLEYRCVYQTSADAPAIVLLHEGLGCVSMWGDFPDRLAAAAGAHVFAYSRAGYGASSPVPLPRPLSYMHDEALGVLGPVLVAAGFQRVILAGHSDGGSIAAIYAGTRRDARVRGLCLIAPHFFVEDISIASIKAARHAYETADLREKLARRHAHVDCAFRGWNGAWLDPDFRNWNICGLLPAISQPTLLIQGEDDPYGTLLQIASARRWLGGPVETLVVPGARHAPHREAPERTLAAIAEFSHSVFAGGG